MNLGDLNPLGNAFAAGDVYGTRYTPMQFHIDIPATLPSTPITVLQQSCGNCAKTVQEITIM